MKYIMLFLVLTLTFMNVQAYSGSEAGYEISLIAYSNASGFSRTEGNYKIGLNLYTSGVGNEHIEQGYKLYLVPGQAFISYLCGITANDPPCGGPISPVPEAPTIIMLSIGLLVMLLIRLKSLRY